MSWDAEQSIRKPSAHDGAPTVGHPALEGRRRGRGSLPRYTASLTTSRDGLPELSTHLGPATSAGTAMYTRLMLPFNRALVQRIEDAPGTRGGVRIEIRGNVIFRRIKKLGHARRAEEGVLRPDAWQPERPCRRFAAGAGTGLPTVNIDRDHGFPSSGIGWDEFSSSGPCPRPERHEQLRRDSGSWPRPRTPSAGTVVHGRHGCSSRWKLLPRRRRTATERRSSRRFWHKSFLRHGRAEARHA
jgi:hypothetical protein